MASAPTIRPCVGLGIFHGGHGSPKNLVELRWAKAELVKLRAKGYRRIVIEREAEGRDEPYFDALSDYAKKLGFDVERQSKENHEKILRLSDIIVGKKEALGAKDFITWVSSSEEFREYCKAVVETSKHLAALAFKTPGTVLACGRNHVWELETRIAPQSGIAFEARYHSNIPEDAKAISDYAWGVYEKDAKKGAGKGKGVR